SRLPDHTPNNLYATRDNQFVHIAAGSDPIFKRLAPLMNRADLLDDARFTTGVARAKHAEEIDDIVAAWTRTFDALDLEERLAAAEIPAGRILTMADIFRDPQYAARGMLATVPDDDFGSVTLTGVVPKLSETPGEIRWSGRRIGQDTDRILEEIDMYAH
ncbi:MAG: CoA transferase, partial [Vulcanimicrobiaceae bacterium]